MKQHRPGQNRVTCDSFVLFSTIFLMGPHPLHRIEKSSPIGECTWCYPISLAWPLNEYVKGDKGEDWAANYFALNRK